MSELEILEIDARIKSENIKELRKHILKWRLMSNDGTTIATFRLLMDAKRMIKQNEFRKLRLEGPNELNLPVLIYNDGGIDAFIDRGIDIGVEPTYLNEYVRNTQLFNGDRVAYNYYYKILFIEND